jgi:hypothetical protein
MTRLLLSAILLLSPSAFAAVDIGVAAAVRGKVSGAAPGAAGRVVETGLPVYQNDKITTGPDSKLQILLLDETTFTIGPNSEMTLDDFVYDPATNVGKVSAKVAKGTFRFITGKVARKDPDSMKVKLNVGTIGIRGTMVAGVAGEKEATIVLLGPGLNNNADETPGAITASNEQGSVEVDQDGWGVNMKAGEKPSDPFQVPAGQLDGILSGVASAPRGDGQDGGAGGGESAGESSGQDTAAGKDNLKDAFAVIDQSQGDTSTFATQQSGAPRVSKWDDVRGIMTGSARYNGSAPYYECPGGNCQSSPAGTATLALDINFAARTLGGGTSGITLTNPSTTGNISSLSFASLSGDASTPLSITGFGNWSGTSVKLLDVGGVTAAAASVDIRFVDTSTSQSYRGEVTGTR